MDCFLATPDSMNSTAGDMHKLLKNIRNIESRFSRIQRSLNFNVKHRESIESSLRKTGKNLSKAVNMVESLSNGLSSCAKWYADTENNVLKNAGGNSSFNSSGYGNHDRNETLEKIKKIFP